MRVKTEQSVRVRGGKPDKENHKTEHLTRLSWKDVAPCAIIGDDAAESVLPILAVGKPLGLVQKLGGDQEDHEDEHDEHPAAERPAKILKVAVEDAQGSKMRCGGEPGHRGCSTEGNDRDVAWLREDSHEDGRAGDELLATQCKDELLER